MNHGAIGPSLTPTTAAAPTTTKPSPASSVSVTPLASTPAKGGALRPQPPATSPAPPPNGYIDVAISMSPDSSCGRTEVDLDAPAVVILEPTDSGLGDDMDFAYDACAKGLRYRTVDGMSLGFGRSGALTKDECALDARRQPLAEPEPITSVKVGTVLCAVTSQKAVGWIRVNYVGGPYVGDLPTLKMTVTLWK
jgi:hypothetical protein